MGPQQPTAIIIAFPKAPERAAHKLLPKDKVAAREWEFHAGAYGFDRIAIHEQLGGQTPEDADFVLIYRTDDRWARWGAARQGDSILLWRCANGAEVGIFADMKEALDVLLDPALRVPDAEVSPALPEPPIACCPGARG